MKHEQQDTGLPTNGTAQQTPLMYSIFKSFPCPDSTGGVLVFLRTRSIINRSKLAGNIHYYTG